MGLLTLILSNSIWTIAKIKTREMSATRAGSRWLLTHLFLIVEPKHNKLLRFTPCGGGILFGIFSTSFACHSSLKTSINWILSTLKGSVISVFLKYELFVYILKSTKRMNKFDRVSAKLQIYFQTRVFYVFEQNNAFWKNIWLLCPVLPHWYYCIKWKLRCSCN